jgi:hypothetical protein
MKKLPDITDDELKALQKRKKELLEKIIGKEFEKTQNLKQLR